MPRQNSLISRWLLLALLIAAVQPSALRAWTSASAASDRPADAQADVEALVDASRFVEAERIVRERLEAHASAKREGKPAAIDDLELLARILSSTGRLAESEGAMRRALALRERIGDPVPLGRALNRLAYVANGRTDYRTAENLSRRAIAVLKAAAGGEKVLTASWGTLGASLAGQRRRPEASIAFQNGIEIGRRVLGGTDTLLPELYNDLALNLEEMGKLAEAEAIYRQNLDLIVRIKGAGHLQTARSLALLSTNLDRQEKYRDAEAPLREAIAIREKVLGPGNPDTIRSLNNLVGLLTRLAKLDEAAEVQSRVSRLQAELPERRIEHEIQILGQQGMILKDQGRLSEAIDHQRRALALSRERLDPGHPYVAIGMMALARSLATENAKSSEYVKLMREAVEIVRNDFARARSVRGNGQTAPIDRALAAAIDDNGQPGRTATEVLALALTLNANFVTQFPREESQLRAQSFMIAQDLASTITGRALTGVVARESQGDGSLARLIRRQQDLAAEVRRKDRELVSSIGTAPDTAERLRSELGSLGARLAATDSALRRAYPDYARLVEPRALTVEEVRRRLGKNEGLLLIVEGEFYNFSFAVSKKGVDWDAVPRLQAFAAGTIEAFRCEVDELTCTGDRAPSPAFRRDYAWDLYRLLVGPVESVLTDVKTLYVTTSGPLSDLPFQALITAKPEGPDNDETLAAQPWLSDRYAIVGLPSVAALRAVSTKRRTRGTTPFIGYGAPELAPAGAPHLVPSGPASTLRERGSAIADPGKIRRLAPLPGTETELKAMAALLGASSDTIRLGAAATETAVRSDVRLKRARIIAFATHGLLPGELDGFNEPGLVFTPPDKPSASDDGVLAASEATALDLSADWVLLSACNTATADGKGGGDALSALASAFLYAGSRALLASRWRVSDTVTAALTVETLGNAKRAPRAGRAAAFQAAMRAIRTGKRADGSIIAGWTTDWAHPASWAPFTLIAYDD